MGWRLLRSRKAGVSAQDAVRHLMGMGFMEIRFTTHLIRREMQEEGPSSPLSYIERLRMIADVCHNLPGDFRWSSDQERERRAVESLRFHLRGLVYDDPVDSQAAQWVRTQLDEVGFDYLPLLPEQVRARLTEQ
ncbi:hypothetical protein GCM10023194_78820 [Planotetraspora phitsanulokensis]|uniref:Uncharacterized protein n=1 Tax=Planotetraspora phitsanulokensis TaxID=575192 RepID=A0A8J3U9M3_9ACTN|nr:hypothetical protein [Planotetraspora phitsanulokensis]GII41168.1 hypothetical protein Pph01_61710 [Planotetraspora phitsanulokensis]